MHYRPEIDGLRAVAVIPVILCHAGIGLFSGGYIGVDIFFVISGYLITTIVMEEMHAGKFNLGNFYERRARRILPALLIVIAACTPFAWFALSPSDIENFAFSIISVSLFSSNFFFWLDSDYFSRTAELKPLLHTWSLAVEEQYYFVFPLMLMACWKFGQTKIVALLIALFVSSLALAQWGAYNSPTAAFYLLPFRGWEILMGALSAFYLMTPSISVLPQLQNLTSSIGLFLILFAIITFNATTPMPSVYGLIPTVGTVLIIIFANKGTFAHYLLTSRPAVLVGLISYSAYLWHQPIFAFARVTLPEPPNVIFMLLLSSLSLLLAAISWKTVENHFRSKTRFPASQKQVFLISTSSLALLVVVGSLTIRAEGFIEQKLTDSQRLMLSEAQPSPYREKCHPTGREYIHPQNACTYIGIGKAVATFGDSHTVELAYALALALEKDNQKVLHLSRSACHPAFNRQTPLADQICEQWTQETVKYLQSRDDIENVIVSYRIAASLFGDHAEHFPKHIDEVGEIERNTRWRSYVELLTTLDQMGKNVVLVLQAPELPNHIAYVVSDSSNHDALGNVQGVSTAWWQERMAYVYSRLSDIPKTVQIVDPAKALCDSKFCYAGANQKGWYFDDDHLSIAGAQIVATEVVKKLESFSRGSE